VVSSTANGGCDGTLWLANVLISFLLFQWGRCPAQLVDTSLDLIKVKDRSVINCDYFTCLFASI
jgi:hypothetical protein